MGTKMLMMVTYKVVNDLVNNTEFTVFVVNLST